MKKEIWKDINEYEGFYQVSNLGNIKSLKRTANHKCGGTMVVKEKILKQEVVKGNYRRIRLSKHGKTKRFLVHRLVAIAFINIDENRTFVNHIDKNPSNNNLNNLEWVNKRENQTHAFLNKSNKHYAIHYCKSMKSYQISLFYNGIKNYLGSTKNIDKALKIRDKFIKEKQIKNKYIC